MRAHHYLGGSSEAMKCKVNELVVIHIGMELFFLIPFRSFDGFMTMMVGSSLGSVC